MSHCAARAPPPARGSRAQAASTEVAPPPPSGGGKGLNAVVPAEGVPSAGGQCPQRDICRAPVVATSRPLGTSRTTHPHRTSPPSQRLKVVPIRPSAYSARR